MIIKNKTRRIISIIMIAGMLATSQGIPALAMLNEQPGAAYEELCEQPGEVYEEDVLADGAEAIESATPSGEADIDGELENDIEDDSENVAENDTESSTENDIVDDLDAISEASSSETDAEIPDELIASISEEEKQAAAEERATSPLELGFVPGEIIIEYDSNCLQEDIDAVIEGAHGEFDSVLMETEESTFALVKISDDTRVDTAIAIYEAFPQIKSAGKNAIAFMSGYETEGTNDPYIGNQYSFKNQSEVAGGANIFRAWDRINAYVATGNELNSVHVTVIDTGCRVSHEDLVDVIDTAHSGEIYSNLTVNTLKGDNYNNGKAMSGKTSHGTHVTGIIGAKAGNNIGVAGAASILGNNLELSVIDAALAMQNSTGDGFAISMLVKALNTAKDNGAQVINMSLGALVGSGNRDNYSQLENAVDAIHVAGIVVVCAAGNNSSSDFAIPSDYESTISVINTNSKAERAASSNYGITKDICAPGTGIISTYGEGDKSYASLNGTSMSSPLVAAIVAMMLSVNPNLEPEDVRTILRNTATDLGATGSDAEYAAGLVNADAAVKAAIYKKFNDGRYDNILDYTGEGTVIEDGDDDENNNVENNDVDNQIVDDTGNDNSGDNSGNNDNSNNNSGNTVSSGRSGKSSGGGGGGGGGGGASGGSSAPSTVEGTISRNPLTGKQKFVSKTGETYTNAWVRTETHDASGRSNKSWIYTDANGDVAAGWQWIRCPDGQIRRFYFSEAPDATYGSCYMGKTTPDGNTVDGNGYWTVNGAVQLSGQETVTRIPAAEAGEAARAAAERTKSSAELGYVPGQLVLKTTGNRQQIDANVALMGGKVAGVTAMADGTSMVVVEVAPHTTTATAEKLYKANPAFTGVTKNAVLFTQ